MQHPVDLPVAGQGNYGDIQALAELNRIAGIGSLALLIEVIERDKQIEQRMKIGDLVLFPAIAREADTTIIAASGTSCRHQVKDGTGRKALHPAEILYNALKKS